VSFDREPIVSLDRAVLRQVRAFIRSMEENLEAGRGLWFDGPVGTGKTSLAILVAKAAKDAGRSYAVFPVPRLLAEIKRTFDRDASDSYMGFFRRLCTVDLLVLDDLGAEKQTEWVLEQLYSIVNERWQDRRSIVVTTNLPDQEPDTAGAALRAAAHDLREAAASGRISGRDLDELRRIVDRAERLSAQVNERELVAAYDPIVRLRRQIGSRTVSRLIEICDDPLPIMGEDLRMSAQGA
jgi:DNA replication protein DnaC